MNCFRSCLVVPQLVLAGVTTLPVAHLQAAILAETKPFISPKGAYVTEQGLYHTYRIPGMVVAADGSILAFAEGRRGDGSDPRRDDNAPIDLVMRRSTDGGQTWQPQVVLDSGFKANGAMVDFADPTPVLDQTTGDVFLLYGQWPDFGPITANWGQDPDSANGNQVVWVQSSSDQGVTWSGPTQIFYPDDPNDPVYPPADGLFWRNAEPGPGGGIQLQWQTNPALNGRLVIPAKRKGSTTPDGTTSSEGFIYYSDDHGTTWQVGDAASAGGNENEVVEITSGDLLLDARANPRTRFTSSDGGNTWADAPDSDVPITTVDASMIRYSAVRAGDDRDRLLFSGPGGEPVGSGSGRSNQLVWTSYDEGRTFINPVQFNSEQAAYSVLAKLNNGTIGMVVESTGNEPSNLGQSYGDITYYNFDLAELEKADHPATMLHYDGFGNSIDAFRGGVGWSGGWNNSGVTVKPGALEFPGFFTAGDDQHAHLRDAGMTRNLGSGAIDLNTNQDYYFSLFINHADRDATDSGTEFLDILLQDSLGLTHAAFGVGSNENFFITAPGGTVSSGDDVLQKDSTYLLLVRLTAQDNAGGGNYDQLFVSWYNDPSQVPADETAIHWQLVGNVAENSASTIEQISILGGANADWLVDGLRIGTTFDAVIVDTGVGPSPVLGDLNSDWLINIADWLIFRGNMTLDTSALSEEDQLGVGDFDNSGLIGPKDFVLFVDLFDAANGLGAFTATLARVPEPSSLLLFCLGTMAVMKPR